MQTPAFFDQVPTIVVHDALAQTLGAVHDGLIEYRYIDAVKAVRALVPDCAGATDDTRAALARLYLGRRRAAASCGSSCARRRTPA